MAQAIESLLCNLEALSSNLSPTEKKNKKRMGVNEQLPKNI
jgi:hypothetical protein